MRTRALLIAALLAAVAVGLHAQQQSGPPKAGQKPAEKRDEVKYGADLWKGPWDGEGVIVLKGSVWFQHEDTRLTSDLVEYNARKEVKTAVSPGKVTISNPECDIAADKGSADFIKKLMSLDGNVSLLLKPKPEGQEPADKDSLRTKVRKPTTISCPKLDYLYKQKIVSAKGGVTFVQDDRRVTADEAVFDQGKELLTLTGSVQGSDAKGQMFAAPKVTISFKKGDEWIEVVQGKATVKVDLEEEQDTEGPR